MPANFVVESAFPGVTFTVPTKIVWLPDGRALVAEKAGRVWAVQNGVKASAPMVSITAQVLDADDRGLLSIAVDPNYTVNRYIYLLYTVDPDSNDVESNAGAYARLCRYTVNATDQAQVVASSRVVLFGSTWTNGIVSCSPSHTIGDLAWGADGSLLISAGEGAAFNVTDPGGLQPESFGPGRTDPSEDIGAFRSQSLSSLAGKILRLDPATGWGYASNPWYNGDVKSIRSRIWAYGLRNPFRFTVRPGTGVADPAVGNPGAIFLGDVGFDTWEEQNILSSGGVNLGWPCYEGVGQLPRFQSSTPSHNGCGSMGTPDNPEFQTAPTLAYSHTAGTASVPPYPGLSGNAAVGGTFYQGTLYPATYRQQYFFGDYGQNWVRMATIDATNNVVSVTDFGSAMGTPVCFTSDPATGDVLYVSIVTGEVMRIRYTASPGNTAPLAYAGASPSFGALPLQVVFSSAGSVDPDGDPVSWSWSFGDASGSTLAEPTHTYTAIGTYTAVLTVTDGRGGVGRDTVTIDVTATSNFPLTAVLDNFNRDDGLIGSSWSVDKPGLVIKNKTLRDNAADNTGMWNSAIFGADQEAYVTLRAITAASPEHALILKAQGLTLVQGHVVVRYGHSLRSVSVITYSPTQGWETRGAPLPVTFVKGDLLGARALANGTLEVYRNAGLLGTRSLAGWSFVSSGGRVGLRLVGATGSTLDNFGGGSVTITQNTPPTVAITSPPSGSFFVAGQNVGLAATVTDAQDAASSLIYQWDVELHHNTHIHFGATFATPTASFVADDHDDGTGVFYRIRLTVRDTGGLIGRDSVDFHPEIDLSPTAITISPASPTAGADITASFAVQNLGRMQSNVSRWRLRAGSTLLGEGDVVVPALGSVAVSVVLTPPLPAGSYALRAVLDTLAQVTETNESNNVAMKSLTVSPSLIPFQNTAVLDNFNRADGELGANWLNAGAARISNNQLAPGAGERSPVWNGATFGPEQEAYIKLSNLASSSSRLALMLKIQGATWSSGHIEVRYDGVARQVTVSTYAPTSGWTVRGVPLNLTLEVGDRLGARARADGSVEVWRNTSLLTTYSVTGWPFAANGGRIGLTLDEAAAARPDDFGGGNSAGGVTNTPPFAAASAAPRSGVPPLDVEFSSAGSGDQDNDPLGFAWVFGDGATGSGASATHRYDSVGEYTAGLTVNDGRGGSATAAVAVSVTATPPDFPTTTVLDAFDRANGVVGGSWVGNLPGLVLWGQQLMPVAADVAVVWNGASFAFEQEAFVTLAAINPDALEHDLLLKVQGLSWDTGCIRVRYDATGPRVTVSTYVSSQGWVTHATYNTTLTAGDRFGARARSDGTVTVYRNSTRLGITSVASWPYAGNGGWLGLKFVAADGARLDDFGGGDFIAGLSDTDSTGSQGPTQVQLSGGLPNPTTAGVQMALSLPRAAQVGFAIFDLAGRQAWTQDLRPMPAGRVMLEWDGRTRDGVSVPSGAYLARVIVDGRVLLRRLAVLR